MQHGVPLGILIYDAYQILIGILTVTENDNVLAKEKQGITCRTVEAA